MLDFLLRPSGLTFAEFREVGVLTGEKAYGAHLRDRLRHSVGQGRAVFAAAGGMGLRSPARLPGAAGVTVQRPRAGRGVPLGAHQLQDPGLRPFRRPADRVSFGGPIRSRSSPSTARRRPGTGSSRATGCEISTKRGAHQAAGGPVGRDRPAGGHPRARLVLPGERGRHARLGGVQPERPHRATTRLTPANWAR